jgi:hypothetical protein
MTEHNYQDGRILLNIDRQYYSTLDIESFFLMMKDPSYCYKFYWLEAIVKLISRDVEETTFNEIIDEMIVNAWYSICEFHIHLSGIQNGEVRDGLERAILKLKEITDFNANASSTEIRNAIHDHEIELSRYKVQLTNMVPYRALAGFFLKTGKPVDWSTRRIISYIQEVDQINALPYTLGLLPGLKKEVHINPAWAEMIKDNTVSILGWIQYEKLKWLQTNNPEVPGLVHKLLPMDEKMRKLNKVHKLWEGILERAEISDVFTSNVLNGSAYDIDHFIPWSFVMNDELWNLMPMDSGLNSSKSNNLPKWDPFFDRFSDNQYVMYQMINTDDEIHKRYEGCYRDNLHSIWAGQELYRPGNTREVFKTILETNMRPLYDSAKRQGYAEWQYQG